MDHPDLICFFFPELAMWERQAVEPILAQLSRQYRVETVEVDKSHQNFFKHRNNAKAYWILARHWVHPLRFLGIRHCSKPTFVSVLGPPVRYSLFSLFWRTAQSEIPDNVVLLTHSPMSQRFFREMKQLSTDRVRHLPFSLLDSFADQAIAPDSERPVCVGTFSPFTSQNNLSFFMGVAHCVAQQCPDVQFKVLGRGSLQHHLKEVADELDLADQMEIKNNTNLLSIQELDIFLYVPLQNQHFIPLLAASSFSLPVVAEELAGVEKHITDGSVVPVHDTESLARLVVHLCGDASQRRAQGQELRAHLEKEYSPDKVAGVYEGLFFGENRLSVSEAA